VILSYDAVVLGGGAAFKVTTVVAKGRPALVLLEAGDDPQQR